MNCRREIFFAAVFVFGPLLPVLCAAQTPPSSAAQPAGLYPNDFGPADIDVSSYPKEMKQNYRLFAFKCAACHTIARPINSQFVELNDDEIKKAEADQPEIFKDALIWRVEPMIWSRNVRGMMSKPGCPVGKEDGKKIWEFLVYDAKARKIGANAAAWRRQRVRLVRDFYEKYPAAYKQLFGSAPPPSEKETKPVGDSGKGGK